MELKYYLRGLGLGIVVTAIIMGIAASKNRRMTDAEIIARAKQLGMIEGTVLTDNSDKKEDMQVNPPETGPDEESEIPESKDGQKADAEDGSNVAASANGSGASQNGAAIDTDEQENGTDLTTDAEAEGSGQEDNDGSKGRAEQGSSDVSNDKDVSEEEDEKESDLNNSGSRPQSGAGGNDSGEPIVITIGSGDGSYAASKKLEAAGAVSSASEFDTFLCQNGYDKKIRTGTYTIPANASEEQMARIITGAE